MNTNRTFIDSLKELAIIFAIAILAPMTIHYGVILFSPVPDWPSMTVQGKYYTEAQMEQMIADKTYQSPQQLQALQTELQKAKTYKTELTHYQNTLFYTCLVSGIILILIGLFAKLGIISIGLIFSGAFTLIDGYTSAWANLGSSAKFASLVIALLLVISLTYLKLIRKKQ